jgi:4-hydroxythreonine-4-phosphate dehydrogenase
MPLLVFTQGDPAGIGPEILAKVLLAGAERPWQGLLVAERAALDPLRKVLPGLAWERLRPVRSGAGREEIEKAGQDGVAWLDPTGSTRQLAFGKSGREDAIGALAALDAGIEIASSGKADALVTAPLGKKEIADHLLPDFRGHTDYLAEKAGLGPYGRDYLMCFLAPDLRVALLTVHQPLRKALDAVNPQAILEALRCLGRHTGGDKRIAVAGFNPHAGENGLLGSEDQQQVAPGVEAARAEGIRAFGPFSADSLFARAREGDFDWVLALTHDQGLIPVKTAAFGQATNWTLGLPYLRTSVDHGTAHDIAGRGIAKVDSLESVIETTLRLVAEKPVT